MHHCIGTMRCCQARCVCSFVLIRWCTQFLSPPVQFARWAHMRHFLSVVFYLSTCRLLSGLDQKSWKIIHISESIVVRRLKLHHNKISLDKHSNGVHEIFRANFAQLGNPPPIANASSLRQVGSQQCQVASFSVPNPPSPGSIIVIPLNQRYDEVTFNNCYRTRAINR